MKFSPRKLQSAIDLRNCNANALSKKIGVSHVAVGYWLSGKTVPGANELYELANALGFPMKAFFQSKTRGAR